jgi:hypothetical protein
MTLSAEFLGVVRGLLRQKKRKGRGPRHGTNLPRMGKKSGREDETKEKL